MYTYISIYLSIYLPLMHVTIYLSTYLSRFRPLFLSIFSVHVYMLKIRSINLVTDDASFDQVYVYVSIFLSISPSSYLFTFLL